MKMFLICVVAFGIVNSGIGSVSVQAKQTKNVTIDLNGDYKKVVRPSALSKAKKVIVRNSNKSVVKAKYVKGNKDHRIDFIAKKNGSAKITVKCKLKGGKKKTIVYKVKVVSKKRKSAKEKAKEAFNIQNQYRTAKARKKLVWSDELYEFAMYRIKTSGLDKHKNLDRDASEYFGKYFLYKQLLFAENLTHATSAKEAMQDWRDSAGHYSNLLASNHVIGAIACYNDQWVALFMDQDNSELKGWKNVKLKKVTVKRYDSVTGTYVGGSKIVYYEINNRWDSQKAINIKTAEGADIYLEMGKTYSIYESIKPEDCDVAEKIRLEVLDDKDELVILK